MTTEFKASNGRVIESSYGGAEVRIFDNGVNMLNDWNHLSDSDQLALREYFLHELGVWVDGESGAVVMRLSGSDTTANGRCIGIRLLGAFFTIWEHGPHGEQAADIAARYFEAHPELKPWEDAAPGDAWELTYRIGSSDMETAAAIRTEAGGWLFADSRGRGKLTFVAGRRVWPEVAE
ncbi:hypothetical protein [Pseudomonas sp.]|uniref:hypothetical protein n=1 Tax=Pseudomonas sp. TaxID=306 RepID=UPI00260B4451|nr:hypothetical protein [Pseudomonas sp.]